MITVYARMDYFNECVTAQNALIQNKWHPLGVLSSNTFTFVKAIREITKDRTRGAVKANINLYNGLITFEPCYKKKFSEKETEAAMQLAIEFYQFWMKNEAK